MPKPASNIQTKETNGVTRAQTTLRRILGRAPQDLWLDTIRRTSLTVHDDLVFWMLNQTECDFAVAAHAFYRSDPAFHLDNPRPLPGRPQASDIFAVVLRNWDKGYFRTHALQLEVRDAHPRQIARINQKVMAHPRGSLPFNIPAQFLKPDGGTPATLPPYLSPDDAAHLWPLYDALGLRVPAAAPGLPRRMAKAKGVFNKISFRTRRH